MTDPLATLRAGCQRGEMPTLFALYEADARIAHYYNTTTADDENWIDKRYLDDLAALQQALWPGSMMDCYWTFSDVDGWQAHVAIADPNNRGRNLAVGEACPTLATAWMDAFLAGLQEKDDG